MRKNVCELWGAPKPGWDAVGRWVLRQIQCGPEKDGQTVNVLTTFLLDVYIMNIISSQGVTLKNTVLLYS